LAAGDSLPFDASIGKTFGKALMATVEVGVPIIDDYRVYSFKLQARVGFFFLSSIIYGFDIRVLDTPE
jgi:hypothetical protein